MDELDEVLTNRYSARTSKKVQNYSLISQRCKSKFKPPRPCALDVLFEKGPWTMHACAQSLVKHCKVPT